MLEFKLPFVKELILRMKDEKPLMQFVIGPRQVGKTTGVEQFIESYPGEVHYVLVEADLSRDPLWIREQWQKCFHTPSKKSILIIDEIQKIENWAETLKSLWDEAKKSKKQVKCIFLGSSSLNLLKGLTESLTGRYEVLQVLQWNFMESRELVPSLTLNDYLSYGGYPGSYRFLRSEERFRSYLRESVVNNVIEKDILLNQSVRKPALFRQVAEILSSYPAQEVSYTKLLGQLQESGNVELIQFYISLYQNAFLFRVIEKFSGTTVQQKLSSPKILPACPALCSALSPAEIDKGRILEMMVGNQLLRFCDRVYYWRKGEFEVDYVIKLGKKNFVIEVKSSRRRHSRSMSAFTQQYPRIQQVWLDSENYLELEKRGSQFFADL